MLFINDYMFAVTDDLKVMVGEHEGDTICEFGRRTWTTQTVVYKDTEYKVLALQKNNTGYPLKLLHFVAVPMDFDFNDQEEIVQDFEKQAAIALDRIKRFAEANFV